MKYTNTTRTANMSEYVRVDPSVDGTTSTFRADKKRSVISGVPVEFINGSIRVSAPKEVPSCNTECAAEATESVELRFNAVKGSDLVAIKSELDRLYGQAVATFHLLDGIVPPTHATFES